MSAPNAPHSRPPAGPVGVPTRAIVGLLTLSMAAGFDWPGRGESTARGFAASGEADKVLALEMVARAPDEATRELVVRALEDDALPVRRAAAQAAGRARVAAAAPVLLAWLSEPEAVLRQTAATALGNVGDDGAVAPLVKALEDVDPLVRAAAAGALAKLGAATATEALDALGALTASLHDRNGAVRLAAIAALAQLGDPRAQPSLSELTSDKDATVALAAVRALGRLGDAGAVPTLVELLQGEHVALQVAACQALGTLRDPAALAPLEAVLLGPSALAARAALAAIAHLPGPEPMAITLAQLDRPELAGTAHGILVDATVREPATATALAPLLAALESATDGSAIARLAGVLSEVAEMRPMGGTGPALLAALLAAMERTSDTAVVGALGRSGAPGALLPLLAQLGPQTSDALLPVYLDAVGRLLPSHQGKDTADAAVATLVGVLGRSAGAARRATAGLLGITGSPAAVSALLPLLHDADHQVRLAATVGLGKLGQAEANPALLAQLDGALTPSDLREATAHALGQTATSKTVVQLLAAVVRKTQTRTQQRTGIVARLTALGIAVPRLDRAGGLPATLRDALLDRLTPVLWSDNNRFAAAALEVLDKWHPEPALATVAALLRHRHADRRAQAVLALRRFDVVETRPVLHHLLKTATGQTRIAALTALAEVGDQRDVKAVVAALERGHWPVPAAAMFSLARMAERGALRPFASRRILCRLADRADPILRANLATALGHLGAERCPKASPETWLTPQHPLVVRTAALRWRQQLEANKSSDPETGSGPETGSSAPDCSTLSPQQALWSACQQPAPAGSPPATLTVWNEREMRPLGSRLIALQFANGSIQLATTDDNGRARVAATAAPLWQVFDPAGPIHRALAPAAARDLETP